MAPPTEIGSYKEAVCRNKTDDPFKQIGYDNRLRWRLREMVSVIGFDKEVADKSR